jgi:serine/threonine-protein kinase
MSKIRFLALAALAAAAFASAPAAAQGWGAIAVSPSTGATGYTWNNVNEVDAELRALDFCAQNASDCESAVTFRNACGAVAWGHGGWGWGWDTDEESARQTAMNECSVRADRCQIVRWQCSYE